MISPCILVCSLDAATGYCVGCGRTIEEISTWTALSPGQRQDLMRALPDRLGSLTLADAQQAPAAEETQAW
jgi:predicted Fe-S protein YdhL (DUF1289 family)